MLGLRSLVTLLTVAASAAISAKNGIGSEWPQVTGLQITEESKKAHHTDHFKIDLGFAVRRGQPFEVVVTTSEKLKYDNMTFVMSVNEKASEFSPDFECEVKKSLGDNKYMVTVTTTGDCPVGKYEDITLAVATKNKEGKIESEEESYEYFYPFPIYVLFNAWSEEDKCVYLDDEEMRQEHVLQDYGKVYDGSINKYRTIHWYYGQSHQVALDAVFYLLKTIPAGHSQSALKTAQHISHNQGFHDPNPGEKPHQGNKDGLLEGKWSGDFADGTDPDLWVSTVDILNEWKKTGKPAKYGQCWIFAALQNTLMRAIGIPARQLSAFGARIDASAKTSKDHIHHHVVDQFFEADGTLHHSKGSVWNYHSWNNIWLHRDDDKSGWQSEDGTPPGLGPASVKSTLALDERAGYNISDVISTVHSTLRNYLVECEKPDAENTDLKGCTVEKMIKYDITGAGLILTTKTNKDGSFSEKEITQEFVDPTVDAFIPFPKDDESWLQSNQRLVDDEPEFEVSIEGNGMVVAGDTVEGTVEIQAAKPGTVFEVNVAIDLINNKGDVIKKLGRQSRNVKSTGEAMSLKFDVDAQQYLQKSMHDVAIQVRSAVHSEDMTRIVTKVISFDAPKINLIVPGNVMVDGNDVETFFPVEATYTNTHSFKVNNICLSIHSHELGFKDESVGTRHTVCEDLAPGASIQLKSQLETANEIRNHYVFATVHGEHIPVGYQHATVVHIEG
ncbi:hypothetical protein SARC_06203 [Sphaeroforma arctica JP610]|uniref:Transglutaminase-like domain-containing protein n=1 Tax=Sphaeroforma arctica JP610 TaxID=667725 RepID=A0A0L0FXV6_9EUKA|nr:hypothetical protein SARC_06203 [Sphaeroforma arctica JP610]KNC81474.1 hypothetical protein SARC_06203 [Sphaeroforma arctica JP610]|eukprot:XP_014155376.1 hypothetical protein SARC_06203 [Sphaeroforma arctica JP610]